MNTTFLIKKNPLRAMSARVKEVFADHLGQIQRSTDRMFALLMGMQWVGGIIFAIVLSPRLWTGAQSAVHPHLLAAIFLGGAIAALPIWLALTHPGLPITRFTIAAAQMLFSALLIHLTGGRIETHFHIFGSLAFLAVYRDWRVLLIATAVTGADHVARGIFWPQSIFGVLAGSPWRALEHASWVVFEDAFLLYSIKLGRQELQTIAERQVEQRLQFAALEQAEQAHALLAGIVASSEDAIFSKTLDGIITSWNDGATKTFGYSAAEMIGQSNKVLIPEDIPDDGNILFATQMADGKEVRHYDSIRLRKDGRRIAVSFSASPIRDAIGNITGTAKIVRDVTERNRMQEEIRTLNLELERRVEERTVEVWQTHAKLNDERHLFETLMENSPEHIYFKDTQSRFLRCSRTLAEKFGCNRMEDVIGKSDADFFGAEHCEQSLADEQEIIRTGLPLLGKLEHEIMAGAGLETWALTSKLPFRNKQGDIIGTFGISKDITELKKAEREQQVMELQLRQSQKLESIGQLAAGVAHEINTPTQYIDDNVHFLKDSFTSLSQVLKTYGELLAAARSNTLTPEALARFESLLAATKTEYLVREIPNAINESLEGIERVAKIVRAMKEFSHPGSKDKAAADLNRAIETTLTVAHNEWKYVAETDLDLDPALPPVPCYLGEFNQCILNLVVNASHAIGDVLKTKPGEKGRIGISTRRAGNIVEVRVSDTGTGIPEQHRPKIFEQFFTTKDVGKGTGQGLSMVYGNIVKKHGGTVRFETEMGKGTTFILALPLDSNN